MFRAVFGLVLSQSSSQGLLITLISYWSSYWANFLSSFWARVWARLEPTSTETQAGTHAWLSQAILLPFVCCLGILRGSPAVLWLIFEQLEGVEDFRDLYIVVPHH